MSAGRLVAALVAVDIGLSAYLAWRDTKARPTVLSVKLDGREVQRSLLVLKRNNGGRALGLS